MIVQQDFLDHWKTALLIDLLDDPCAPLYVIRLWGHCQSRKTHRFLRVNPALTKAICKAPHEAEVFEKAMIAAGFIVIENGEIVAHEWDVVNAYLINSWENGKKGGRPRKKNPNITHGLAGVNPDITHAKPIRLEKSRLEKIGVNISLLPAEAVAVVDLIIAHVLETNPKSKNLTANRETTRFKWADSIEKMNRIDGRSWDDIKKMWLWIERDSFWAANILSGQKFRAKYDDLLPKMKMPSKHPKPHLQVSHSNNAEDFQL